MARKTPHAIRLFPRRNGARTLARIERRAERAYAPLYRDGRSKALDRAEAFALTKVAEAEDADPSGFEANRAKVERGFWPKVKKVARQIPFLEDLIAAYFAMRDPAAPMQARAALAFGLLYFLWVFDIIPDFLGFAGYADDGTVLATILMTVGGAITDHHRKDAREALGVEAD